MSLKGQTDQEPIRSAGSTARRADMPSGAVLRTPGALQPVGVLRLQRLSGNAAVARLLQPAPAPSAPVVQRWKHFENAKAVDAFIKDNPVDRKVHTTATKYVTFLKAKLPKGRNKPDDQDLETLTAKAETAFGATSGRERLPLSAPQWRHIWRGDVSEDGKNPTGFHWKGNAAEAWLEGTGDVTREVGGFYHENTRFKADKKPAKANLNKPDGSTFFPDAWTEQEVKDAIETRNSAGQITTPKGYGTTLTKAGETIYPTI